MIGKYIIFGKCSMRRGRNSRQWGPPAEPATDPAVVDPTGASGSSVDPTGEGPSSYDDTTGRGFEDPGAGPSSQAEPSRTFDVPHHPDTFSPLLWTHHVKHRVTKASLEVRDSYT